MEKNGISNNNGTSSSNNKSGIVKSSPQLVPLSELISDSNNSNKETNLPLEEALNHPGFRPSQIILDQSVLMGLLNSIQILKSQAFIGYLGGRWIGKVKGDKVKAVGWVKHFVTCQRSLENILDEDLMPDNNSVQLAEQTFKDLGLQIIGWFRSNNSELTSVSDQLSHKGSILVDYKLAQNLQTKYPHLIKILIPKELIITRGTSNHCPDWQIYRVPSSAELKSNSNKSKHWEKIGYAINSQPYTSPQILKELQNIFQNLAIEGKKTYEIQQAYHKSNTSQNSNFNNFLYESELINLSKTCLSTFELGLNNDFQKLALSKLKLKELINLKLKELETSLSEQNSTDLNLTGDELYDSIKQLVEYAALRPNKKGFSNSNQIGGSSRLGSKSYSGSGDPLFEMPAFPQ
ncbi:hypothetical protein CONCODRAFT_71539 [Conidiobolus coronatus NRRL 28638]|uniref:Uncharacterized protein n=1 Tax=Conidiobolus coronatus (strain ATCC 28846 / CBS 209.66 / NRRL 28638) TaxID=796925 RepID=A0A137P384_CONC2|nr:hypothetical protein CONCODRAFT_71539 [Conidiobolus coronatus NRRL 28638]|eukprot:KXN69381.1 hypothetical protein CONCODRAFT_71539 [Conidiobolus coronatus NRRL 28638]